MTKHEVKTGQGTMSGVDHREGAKVAEGAFEAAIHAGRLSTDHAADNYARRYMFMGFNSDSGKPLFKNIVTRQYID
jgi:hypothetical protein